MRPSLEFYYNKAPPIIFPDYETNSFLLLKGQATAPHSFSVFWANWDSYALKKKRLAYSVCVYAGTESSLKGARAAKPKVLSNLTNRNIDNIDSGGWLSYRLYSYSIAFYQSWYFTPLQSLHFFCQYKEPFGCSGLTTTITALIFNWKTHSKSWMQYVSVNGEHPKVLPQ